MVDLCLIGIGSGNPAHLTEAARRALSDADLVLLPFKGEEKSDLAGLRAGLIDAICPGLSVAGFDMPRRDPELPYLDAVDTWHEEIAAKWSDSIAAHPKARKIVLLVWGDPSLYDSSLRIAARLTPQPRVRVVPGLTSLQMLTAAHAIPLNALGGEVLITTGRQLTARGWPDRGDTVAVMLDGACAFQTLKPEGIRIWWGAFLGMPQQRLIDGRLAEVSDEIVATRRRARAAHGWIMDVYLMRREA